MLLNRTNYFITFRTLCCAQRQLISLKCFTAQITYFHILISGVECRFCTLYTCLVLQQSHIQNPFKHLSVFACPLNDFKPLTVYAKNSILNVLKGSKYTCVQIAPNNVLYYHKHLMGHFEFLDGSRIICFPLNIQKKFDRQHLFEKPKEAETHRLYLFFLLLLFFCFSIRVFFHGH